MALKRLILTVGTALSLFWTIAFADTPYIKYSYFSNWGGLNDQLSQTEVQDNEATAIQNVVFDNGGALKKRYGFTTVPNTPPVKVTTGTVVAVTGLKFFSQNNGNQSLFAIANSDGKATAMCKYYQQGGGPDNGNWVNIDFAGLPSSYSNDNLASISVANNTVVFTVPSSTSEKTPFVWNGTGNVGFLTTNANCPGASINTYHKNQLFLTGNLTYPSRVWFSDLDNIKNYTLTNFFDVQTADGTKVRGLVSNFNSLYIFKDSSIWRLSGSTVDDYVLEKMVDGIGTMSPQSIAIVNNYIYFTTSQNDVGVYDGGYQVIFPSQKIRGTVGSLNFQRANHNLGLAFSTYKYNDFDYYGSVSFAGSASNNRVLVLDTAFKAWTVFAGINANAWCTAPDSNGKNVMYFGDYNGYVNTYPSTTYFDGNVATSPIVSFYQTKWFKYSDISLSDKYWRISKVYASSELAASTLTVECRSDFEASGKVVDINLLQPSSMWDTAIWDVSQWSGPGLIVGRQEVDKGTNMFQMYMSNGAVNQGFTVFGYENFIEPSNRI